MKRMPKTKYIRVEELNILNNRQLFFRLSCSPKIKRFFSSKLFYVSYDKDISGISPSILYIPVISNIVTVAWATGANIYVKELDKTFFESLNKVRSVMREWYPELPFSTNIDVRKIVSNNFSNTKYGLLFSGGVDSTVSYIRHRDKGPNLIMIRGVDIPLNKEELWRRVKNKYSKFAYQENVKVNFLETNIHGFINERLLNAEFGKYLTDFSWWGSIHHGIGILGLCAPLSAVENIRTIFVASSHTREYFRPWGSNPLIDNKISWSNVNVKHDGYELSRQQKIRNVLKPFIINTDIYPHLRSCLSSSYEFNCGNCEKCLRTITGLMLENIDPARCGFNVDRKTFINLKEAFIKRKLTLGENKVFMWKDIQKHIPEVVTTNLYNSKEFFEWFKNFDVLRCRKGKSTTLLRYMIYQIYHKLPRTIQNIILKSTRRMKNVGGR